MASQVAADLRAVAEVLQRDGWTQGRYGDPGECHCVAGAVFAVVGFDPEHSERNDSYWRSNRCFQAILLTVRNRSSRVSEGAVLTWNDEPGRTADEVIAALEAAAEESDRLPEGGDDR